MKVDNSYYQTRTVHRTLPGNADDPANSIVSCGFLHKQERSYVQKDILLSVEAAPTWTARRGANIP